MFSPPWKNYRTPGHPPDLPDQRFLPDEKASIVPGTNMSKLLHQKPRQIFVCEPDCIIRSLLAEVLMEAGFDVQQWEGNLDIARLQQFAPDLLILDLPNGRRSLQLDLIHRLKADTHAAHIPILVLCRALPSNDVAMWIRQTGVAGLLLKPFDLDDLLAAVQSAFTSNDSRSTDMESRPNRASYRAEYQANMDSHSGS